MAPRNSKQPPAGAPFLYKMTFKQSELEKQEIYEYIDDRKIKKKVPIFDGTKGVEALVFLQEQFTKACLTLQLEDDERFEKFEECLTDGAEEHWSNVEGNHLRTNDGFEAALREFYLHYITSDARDIMKQVIEHHCNKPAEVSCREHQNRFETMIRRANKLQGCGSPINAFDTKQWYLHSYPEAWQNDWNTGGKRVRDDSTTMLSITEYMENRKAYYDAKKNSNGKNGGSNKRNNSKGNGRPSKKQKGNNKEDRFDKDGNVLCRKHNYKHPWKDCSHNKDSPNYRGKSDRDSDNRDQTNRNQLSIPNEISIVRWFRMSSV